VAHEQIMTDVAAYYAEKLKAHGASARGVDWSSDASQTLRFEQLLRVCPAGGSFSVNDYGCGYGALLSHLRAKGLSGVAYTGFDIAEQMIEAAAAAHAADNASFVSEAAKLAPRDYTLCSGIFNVRLSSDDATWRRYILDTLDTVARLSVRGFAFNMLTSYSDEERMKDYLYYGDPSFFFDHCKRRYAKNVALLHDYGLYEWTLLVRLETP
jgi:SAM-dependent methyltransferase